MTGRRFPSGWNEERIRRVLAHYETQTEEDAIAEDERAFAKGAGHTTVQVPSELMPVIREVIAQYEVERRVRNPPYSS